MMGEMTGDELLIHLQACGMKLDLNLLITESANQLIKNDLLNNYFLSKSLLISDFRPLTSDF
jgi:hypothetical protein